MNTSTKTGKLHELYEQLIHTPSSIQPIPQNLRMKKRWYIAVSKDNARSQKERNMTVENRHKAILNECKKRFANTMHPVFERDFRNDNSESALAMHAYLTRNFYFHLECDFLYNYQIEYAFYHCLHETQLRALIDRLPEYIKPKEVRLKPDFNTFYMNVLKVQDAKYISY